MLEDNGLKCWAAPRDIVPGSNYPNQILDSIQKCPVFICIVSEHSNDSPQVLREVERAVNYRRYIIPLRLDEIKLCNDLEYLLCIPHWITVKNNDFNICFEHLLTAAKSALISMESGETPDFIAPQAKRGASNLPKALTKIYGRERLINTIQTSLKSARLITLRGIGGIGKTYLAIHSGSNLLNEFDSRIYFLQLASHVETNSISRALVDVLGLKVQPGNDENEQIINDINAWDTNILLIFDNCEQILIPAAKMIRLLLERCSKITILATSTTLLHVPNEHEIFIDGLTDNVDKISPRLRKKQQITGDDFKLILSLPAIQLFADIAHNGNDNFTIDKTNIRTILEICEKLDFIPLAIKLAASRAKSLSVRDIFLRLENRFKLLTSGSHSDDERHQKLFSTIQWSYDLLTPDERTLLVMLQVFPDSFTLEAAEEICNDDNLSSYDVLDLLDSLVDKSQIRREKINPDLGMLPRRYSMFLTIREFVKELALDNWKDLNPVITKNHFDYYKNLVFKENPAIF